MAIGGDIECAAICNFTGYMGMGGRKNVVMSRVGKGSLSIDSDEREIEESEEGGGLRGGKVGDRNNNESGGGLWLSIRLALSLLLAASDLLEMESSSLTGSFDATGSSKGVR